VTIFDLRFSIARKERQPVDSRPKVVFAKEGLRIYIASSWKNQHAVMMLTDLLRIYGHTVFSFVENNHGEQKGHAAVDESRKPIPFEEWVWSERGTQSFLYDTESATTADVVVYVGPSGTDAWAEVGAAWAKCVPIFGLWAKGEQAGLMRRMVNVWCEDFHALLRSINEHANRRADEKVSA
jgi:hypothetical protein